MNIKFSPGEDVAYKPLTSPAVELRQTRIVGFDSEKEFKWKKQHCDMTVETRNKRTATGKVQNRYVIEHFFGWQPTAQKGLNKDLNLDPSRRYYFAYESELESN